MSAESSLIPVERALERILAAQRIQSPTVELPLKDALGAVLAEPVEATVDVPAYDNSAMDGYAVRVSDLIAHDELPVSQTITAGHPGVALEEGTACRIFTGSPIPEGADAVVIQEDTTRSGDRVRILEVPQAGQHIRRRGHDILKHDQVLSAGHRLRSQDLGLLASLGISTVSVSRPLTVAVINTGDEVVAPDRELGPGQLYDSNSFTLTGLLQRLGCRIKHMGIVADTLAETQKVLETAASEADCIITTGGVSVGDADHVRPAIEQLGTLSVWKLAIKPGKPFSFGKVRDVPVFGLPGNPVAVFVTFLVLVRPCLLKILGAEQLNLPQYSLPAGFTVDRPGDRQEYLRVRLQKGADGNTVLECFKDQGSSILTSLSWADGLAVVPVDTLIREGDPVAFIPFDGLV